MTTRLTARAMAAGVGTGALSAAELVADALAAALDPALHFVDLLTPHSALAAAARMLAFPLGEYEANLPGHLCWAFNLSGHPAVTVPAGLLDGLPAGLQAVAAPHRDDLAVELASLGRGQPAGSAGPLASCPGLTSSAVCRQLGVAGGERTRSPPRCRFRR